MNTAAANTRAARSFVAALAAAGVEDACITPGSRSTPLTVAFAEQGAMRPWLHLDERASAYFALGLARAKGRPVALVCTSGTAAANFHPAVAEANLSRVPLVVCTADRPPSLREVGAAQAMAQAGMFGSNVRWAHDLPLPSPDASDPARFAAFALRAAREALGPLPGPVHLNVPFEEPLIEPPGAHPPPAAPAAVSDAVRARPAPALAELSAAAGVLAAARRPLIVAGPETGGLPALEITRLAAALGAPILADPLGGLRTGNHNLELVLDSYDAVLRDPRAEALAPDAVIRFGAVPTSKALNQFLARQSRAVHVLCDLPGSWRDPFAITTHPVRGDAALVAEALAVAVRSPAAAAGWAARLVELDRRAAASMRKSCLAFGEPFEGRVIAEVQDALHAGATLVVGNSMPVRDADAFLFRNTKPLTVACNRGANGIDGVTSAALGTAAAGNGPVVLVTGDVSFYHDIPGLWAAKRHRLDLTIVLVNNDGGGIFHYLPQAGHAHVFEEWFGTAPGLDFAHAVALFGGRHTLAEDWDTFRRALAGGAPCGLNVIEVRTDRVRNAAMHREAWATAAEAAWAGAAVGAP